MRDGATVAERLACSPPTKAIRVQSAAGSLRIFAYGNRGGRCRWSAGFLGVLPFSPPFNSGAALYPLQPPSSALKTSMLSRPNLFTHSLKTLTACSALLPSTIHRLEVHELQQIRCLTAETPKTQAADSLCTGPTTSILYVYMSSIMGTGIEQIRMLRLQTSRVLTTVQYGIPFNAATIELIVHPVVTCALSISPRRRNSRPCSFVRPPHHLLLGATADTPPMPGCTNIFPDSRSNDPSSEPGSSLILVPITNNPTQHDLVCLIAGSKWRNGQTVTAAVRDQHSLLGDVPRRHTPYCRDEYFHSTRVIIAAPLSLLPTSVHRVSCVSPTPSPNDEKLQIPTSAREHRLSLSMRLIAGSRRGGVQVAACTTYVHPEVSGRHLRRFSSPSEEVGVGGTPDWSVGNLTNLIIGLMPLGRAGGGRHYLESCCFEARCRGEAGVSSKASPLRFGPPFILFPSRGDEDERRCTPVGS
ncbi:hypothetical protein PR048_028780 [Dryococelus australis]|uniref:Uncharacterized protein n=1 Tax=Dryococelus australis TaxID=614101 RepID=A0ABQ9GE69_9NEOP|nr:hypothetical protein PR048_028780 [Dryococelus australis]